MFPARCCQLCVGAVPAPGPQPGAGARRLQGKSSNPPTGCSLLPPEGRRGRRRGMGGLVSRTLQRVIPFAPQRGGEGARRADEGDGRASTPRGTGPTAGPAAPNREIFATLRPPDPLIRPSATFSPKGAKGKEPRRRGSEPSVGRQTISGPRPGCSLLPPDGRRGRRRGVGGRRPGVGRRNISGPPTVCSRLPSQASDTAKAIGWAPSARQCLTRRRCFSCSTRVRPAPGRRPSGEVRSRSGRASGRRPCGRRAAGG